MKKARLRHVKIIAVLIIVANLILFYYAWKSTLWKSIATTLTATSNDVAVQQSNIMTKSTKDKSKSSYRHIRKSITMVFRNIYTFENDLKSTLDSILDVVPNMPILILHEGVPYPPLTYERNSTMGEENTVRFFNLAFDLLKTGPQRDVLSAIHTKYVLFMPDSVRLQSKSLLQKLLREINSIAEKKANLQTVKPISDVLHHMIIVPFAGNLKTFSTCTQIKLDLPNWTVQYVAVNASKCDLFVQKHATLLDAGILRELPDAFATPFPEMFYIQAKVQNIKKSVFPQSFQEGRRLFTAYHTKQRRLDIRRRQFREMYKILQIKRVIRRVHKVVNKANPREDSAAHGHNIVLDNQFSSANFSLPQVTEVDLIGCERTTKSCIGSVYNSRPFYSYMGKHTPPCCLDKLKTTFNHVLEEFENVGIRYWLDNTALKSAIDSNKLYNNAYEIDISFNVNDLDRSNALKKAQDRPFIDNEGFYWMKATDGNYFRLQFSKINQISVNLLPFEIHGNIVQASGFFGWKAKDFAVDFLHPMSNVLFLGKNVMCPNNVREFLEFKKIY